MRGCRRDCLFLAVVAAWRAVAAGNGDKTGLSLVSDGRHQGTERNEGERKEERYQMQCLQSSSRSPKHERISMDSAYPSC